MVSPDGANPNSSRKGARGTTLFLAAGVLVIAGLLAMGALTSAEPIAIEDTTTTVTPSSTTLEEVTPPIETDDFSVDQIARGRPLQWESAAIRDKGIPTSLVEFDDWIYLFAGDQGPFGYQAGGMRAWRSRDGTTWEALGEVFSSGHAVNPVSATDQGLIAVESGGSSPFTIWRSFDGATWVPETVEPDGLGDLMTVYTFAVAASEDVLVMSGDVQIDTARLIEDRLGANSDLLSYGSGVDILGDDIQLVVYGPLGFPLVSVSGDELGLTPDERQTIIDLNNQGSSNRIWARTADGTWHQTEIPDAQWIDWLTTSTDGGVVAQGYGPTGYQSWTTYDGITWEAAAEYMGPYRIDAWGDRQVGPSTNDGVSILASNADGTWENLGPGTLFPSAVNWSLGATAAGPGGIAAMVSSWDNGAETPQPDPVTIERDGATLSLDLFEGSYSLQTLDGGTGEWSMTGTTPEGIEVDLDAGTISFHDPVSNELLASFGIEEINRAQSEYYSRFPFDPGYRAFVFSADGDDWTIQDAATIGDDLAIWLLEVTDSRVIAAGVDPAGLTSSDLSPSFGVWSAEIP